MLTRVARAVVVPAVLLVASCSPTPAESPAERDGPQEPSATIERRYGDTIVYGIDPRASVASAASQVDVVLLDPENGEAPRRGCDSVRVVQRPAPPAGNAAEAALRALFALDEERIDGLYNFIASTRDTLHLERVELDGRTARVHLSGRLSGLRGVCDNPRARIQIEETAKRVPGVENVVILLNGRVTDLQPDERGVADGD